MGFDDSRPLMGCKFNPQTAEQMTLLCIPGLHLASYLAKFAIYICRLFKNGEILILLMQLLIVNVFVIVVVIDLVSC